MTQTASYKSHALSILKLGAPLVAGQIAQFGLHMTDTLMLGWYGVDTLAAGVLATAFFFILFIGGLGFAHAVVPLVAAAHEQGDVRGLRRATRMGIWLSVIYALIVSVPLFFSERILVALGQDPTLSLMAQSYLRIAGWGMVLGLVGMVVRNYLSALERLSVVLWVTLAALPLNALINYVLIFGKWGAPELGIEGAAWASICAGGFMMVGLIIYAMIAEKDHQIFANLWRPDWGAMGTVFRLGLPIGLTMLAEVGLFTASSVMVGWIGTVPLAAHGIVLQVAGATFMIHLGLANVGTIRAARAFGAGDAEHLRRGAKTVAFVSAGIALTTMVVFVAIPGTLIGAFLSPDNPERGDIIAVGSILLIVMGISQLADALQAIKVGLLRGVQDTAVPMRLAMLSYWGIGAPCAFFLGRSALGATGVWIGLCIGLAAAAILLSYRFWITSPWKDS